MKSVNIMESKFLSLLQYELFVSTNLYTQYYKQVNSIYNTITKQEEKARRKEEYRLNGFIKSKKNRKSHLLL